MRTAIYALNDTTVTIRPSSETDHVSLTSYNGQLNSAAVMDKPIALPRGIYLVRSKSEVHISGADIKIEISLRDKDEWPEPTIAVIELEKGATGKSIRAFFSIAKDIDV
ncbi:MAG: hypothetical protein R3B48_21550 [Kofleriaceae bacterium]